MRNLTCFSVWAKSAVCLLDHHGDVNPNKTFDENINFVRNFVQKLKKIYNLLIEVEKSEHSFETKINLCTIMNWKFVNKKIKQKKFNLKRYKWLK